MPPYLEEQIAGRSWGVGRRNPGQSLFSKSERAAGRTLFLSLIAVVLLASRSTAVSPINEVRRVLIINTTLASSRHLASLKSIRQCSPVYRNLRTGSSSIRRAWISPCFRTEFPKIGFEKRLPKNT